MKVEWLYNRRFLNLDTKQNLKTKIKDINYYGPRDVKAVENALRCFWQSKTVVINKG